MRENFREGFDFDTWISRPGPAGAGAADVVLGDEDAWLQYLGKHERLRAEMSRRPPHVTDDLDLPVMREISARREAHRLEEERRAKQAAEKAERDALDREESLLRSVEAAMRDGAGTWMSAGRESLGGISPAAMARRSQADLWKAVSALDR